MPSKPKSVSIDEEQQIEIERYMEFTGIKTFSGGIHSLIHKGLNCRCSNGNNGVGVKRDQTVSSGKKPPECFGKPGDGFCEECLFKDKCMEVFVNL